MAKTIYNIGDHLYVKTKKYAYDFEFTRPVIIEKHFLIKNSKVNKLYYKLFKKQAYKKIIKNRYKSIEVANDFENESSENNYKESDVLKALAKAMDYVVKFYFYYTLEVEDTTRLKFYTRILINNIEELNNEELSNND